MARPGTSRGYPHRHKGEWDTQPSALKDKGIPLWERRIEGRWANSARICPWAEPAGRPSPAQLQQDLRHPALDPARLRVQVHNSAIQPPSPQSGHEEGSGTNADATNLLQPMGGGRGGRQALLGSGGREPGSLPTPEQGGWILSPLVQNEI
uniref:Uncharacterized protein n=1 Tax=Myotis myotis TaxID=51298 RepID=A0A7J7XHH3_MYOMY|nr:hypothetical protein mMyoMyo1_011723 [Myotis myotis]